MIKYLLFDLDNTLYSCKHGLEDNVSRRIREFTASYLGVTVEEAWRQRMANMRQYGTCLEWLMTEKGLTDIEAYLAAVHPPDEAENLFPDGPLRELLASITLPKAILTNAPLEHAELVLGKLQVHDLFTHVFDIRQCNFRGKPHCDFYNLALRTLGVPAAEVLFIDDSPVYVEGFIALGGNALLFDENNIHQNHPANKIQNLKEITQFM